MRPYLAKRRNDFTPDESRQLALISVVLLSDKHSLTERQVADLLRVRLRILYAEQIA